MENDRAFFLTEWTMNSGKGGTLGAKHSLNCLSGRILLKKN